MRRIVTENDLYELRYFIGCKLNRLVVKKEYSETDYVFIRNKCNKLIDNNLEYGGLMHNYNALIGIIRMFVEEWRDDACNENNVKFVDILDMVKFLDQATNSK